MMVEGGGDQNIWVLTIDYSMFKSIKNIYSEKINYELYIKWIILFLYILIPGIGII